MLTSTEQVSPEDLKAFTDLPISDYTREVYTGFLFRGAQADRHQD